MAEFASVARERMRRAWPLLAYGVCSIAAMAFCFYAVVSYAKFREPSLAFALAALCLLLLLVAFARLLRARPHDPAHAFLLVGVPAVAAFGLFILPGSVPDEPAHMAQALSLFGRHMGTWDVPSVLPQDGDVSYAAAYDALVQADTWADMWEYSRCLDYYDHLYLLPSIVIFLFRLVGANAYLAALTARVVNGLLFVAAGFWMLRMMPYGKTALFVFLLNPMLVQQEASFSADCVVNIAVLMYVVYFMRLNCAERVGRGQVCVLAGLALFMFVSKFMFAPLVLLPLVFVKRVLPPKRALVAYLAVFAACCVVGCLVIASYHGSFMPDAFELMRQPKELLRVMLNTFYIMVPMWMRWYAGSSLGPLSISLWEPALWTYAVLQILVLFYNDEDNQAIFTRLDKVFVCLLAFANFVLIILTMRGWSLTVDEVSDYIMGVQGRYLFPLALLCLTCLLRPRARSSQGGVLAVSAVLLVVCYAVNMLSIFSAFGISLFPL